MAMENAVESLPDNLVQIAGKSSNKHKIVSLFSGCGGMDIASLVVSNLRDAPIENSLLTSSLPMT